MKGVPRIPSGSRNTGLPDLTNIMKLRRWGTALIKAGQKNRDPRMLLTGIKLHIHSQKLGTEQPQTLGTQTQPTLGTQAGS